MAEMMTTDVRAIMDRTPFDVSAVADLRELLNRDPVALPDAPRGRGQYPRTREEGKRQARDATCGWGSARSCWAGTRSGLEHLKKAGDVGMACFFQGLAYENLQKYDEAAKAFAQAAKLGYDAKNSELHRAGALRRTGHAEEAKKMLGGLAEAGRLVGRVPLPARVPSWPPRASSARRRPSWRRP